MSWEKVLKEEFTEEDFQATEEAREKFQQLDEQGKERWLFDGFYKHVKKNYPNPRHKRDEAMGVPYEMFASGRRYIQLLPTSMQNEIIEILNFIIKEEER
jgi:tRNA(Met) C34 N-acetyltransferase TmcA